MEGKNNHSKESKTIVDFGRQTLNEIVNVWREIVGKTRRAITGKINPDLEGEDADHVSKMISECVFPRCGEISTRSKAVDLGLVYLHLSLKGRENFLSILAERFDADKILVESAVHKYINAETENLRKEAEMSLSQSLIPPRLKLLKQFNALPNGFKFLIDFRADLLPIRKQNIHLRKLDNDLKDILSSWFDVGLLDLKEINWESPAYLLEKLIKYEAVHEIRSWNDLKNRLDSDRYCFAFFHNKVQDEPLIFVEVALTQKISSSIQKLLDEDAVTINPQSADTAIFYSISSTQRGLSGVKLGNFLIKRVVEELSKKLNKLKHFVTLSPIPGFRKWLATKLQYLDETVFKESEIESLKLLFGGDHIASALLQLLDLAWYENQTTTKVLKPILLRLCAFYLINEKRGNRTIDSVAHFHLSNGAYLKHLNWLADRSFKGLRESAGLMANYYYKLTEIEKNHEMYVCEAKVNCSKEVRALLS